MNPLHPDAARVRPLVTRPFSFAECLHTPPMLARYSGESDVVAVESEAAIRARLADDPWGNEMLTTVSVEPWSVFLRATR